MIWGLIGAIVAAATLWAALTASPASWDMARPLLVAAALLAIGWYWTRRGSQRLAAPLFALAQVVVFSTGFVFLTYLGATVRMPLVDEQLAACDRSLGFDLPRFMVGQPAALRTVLAIAYDTLLLQTAALVAILGLCGDRALRQFVLRMILAALATFLLFLAMPAEGPFSYYGFAASESQTHYLEHFRGLRAGQWMWSGLDSAEGLITFPSFHTVWAVLLAVAVAHRRWIALPFLVLNVAVVLSTLTTGWHYLSDVLAGFAVALLVCCATGGLAHPPRGPDPAPPDPAPCDYRR